MLANSQQREQKLSFFGVWVMYRQETFNVLQIQSATTLSEISGWRNCNYCTLYEWYAPASSDAAADGLSEPAFTS